MLPHPACVLAATAQQEPALSHSHFSKELALANTLHAESPSATGQIVQGFVLVPATTHTAPPGTPDPCRPCWDSVIALGLAVLEQKLKSGRTGAGRESL